MGRSTRIGWATMASRIWSSVAMGSVRPSSSAGVPRTRSTSRGPTPIWFRSVFSWALVQPAFTYSTTVGFSPAASIAARVLREVPQAGLWKMVTSMVVQPRAQSGEVVASATRLGFGRRLDREHDDFERRLGRPQRRGDIVIIEGRGQLDHPRTMRRRDGFERNRPRRGRRLSLGRGRAAEQERLAEIDRGWI